MKKKIALTQEQIDQRINAGKEKLLRKKNRVIETAEKKFLKGLIALDDKFKIIKKKAKEPKAKKNKDETVINSKISKKEIKELHKSGKSVVEIAQQFDVEVEFIKAKLHSLGLPDKNRKK